MLFNPRYSSTGVRHWVSEKGMMRLCEVYWGLALK
jgi:hypothetical protein